MRIGELYSTTKGGAVTPVWPPSVWVSTGGGKGIPNISRATVTNAELRKSRNEGDVLWAVVSDGGKEFEARMPLDDVELRDVLLEALRATLGKTVTEISEVEIDYEQSRE